MSLPFIGSSDNGEDDEGSDGLDDDDDIVSALGTPLISPDEGLVASVMNQLRPFLPRSVPLNTFLTVLDDSVDDDDDLSKVELLEATPLSQIVPEEDEEDVVDGEESSESRRGSLQRQSSYQLAFVDESDLEEE